MLQALTLRWAAPELLGLGAKHTIASDIFAFGIVLWEVGELSLPSLCPSLHLCPSLSSCVNQLTLEKSPMAMSASTLFATK